MAVVAEGPRGSEKREEEPGGDTGDREPTGPLSTAARVAVAGFVAVLVLVVVVVLVKSSQSSPGGAELGDGESRGGKVGEVVRIDRTLDSFNRPDDPLGLTGPAEQATWTPDVGAWGILGEQAYVSEPAEGRNLAVRDLGEADGVVQVELSEMSHGAGIVFRYRSPSDYWMVVPVPYYGTWAAYKVIGGDAERVATTGLLGTTDRMTVGVRLQGDTIDVIVNGAVRATIVDGTFVDATKVGMTVEKSGAGEARFDEFKATGQGNGQVLGAANQ
jgi:hypothetical protein